MADLAATNARGNTKLEDKEEDEDEDEEGLAAAAPAVVAVVVGVEVVEEAEGSVGVMVVAERATRGATLEEKLLTFNLIDVPILNEAWKSGRAEEWREGGRGKEGKENPEWEKDRKTMWEREREREKRGKDKACM